MTRPVSDYVALSLIGRTGDIDDIFGTRSASEFKGSWAELKAEAQSRCGFELNEQILRDAIRGLAQCGLVRISEDRHAGEFIKIYPDRFREFITKAQDENASAVDQSDVLGPTDRPSDYPNANALLRHPVFEDFGEFGDDWLRRALAGLKEGIERAGSLAEFSNESSGESAPAADRIVRFSDNEVLELEAKTSEIIEGVEALNSIGEQAGFRDLILGQLRAGRELVRAGSVKVYLLQITLIDTLNFLAKRYEHDVIGALASALAIALAKHLGLEV